MKPIAICLIGLQFSAKAEAIEVAKNLGLRVHSTGDHIREMTLEIFNAISFHTVTKYVDECVLKNPLLPLEPVLTSTPPNSCLVVDSVHCPDQIEALRRAGFDPHSVAFWAPPAIRWERRKGRSRDDDPKSLGEFNLRDDREIRLGLGGLMALSEYMIDASDQTLAARRFGNIVRRLVS